MCRVTFLLVLIGISVGHGFQMMAGRGLVGSSLLRSSGERRSAATRSMGLDMMFGSMGGSSSKINVPKGKKLCVVTGTTSGLGKETARSLIESGEYFVVCACRNVEKMEGVAKEMNFDSSSYKVMELDLGSFDSTKKFAKNLRASKSRALDALVCNAAVYQPALQEVSVHKSCT